MNLSSLQRSKNRNVGTHAVWEVVQWGGGEWGGAGEGGQGEASVEQKSPILTSLLFGCFRLALWHKMKSSFTWTDNWLIEGETWTLMANFMT